MIGQGCGSWRANGHAFGGGGCCRGYYPDCSGAGGLLAPGPRCAVGFLVDLVGLLAAGVLLVGAGVVQVGVAGAGFGVVQVGVEVELLGVGVVLVGVGVGGGVVVGWWG